MLGLLAVACNVPPWSSLDTWRQGKADFKKLELYQKLARDYDLQGRQLEKVKPLQFPKIRKEMKNTIKNKSEGCPEKNIPPDDKVIQFVTLMKKKFLYVRTTQWW